MLKSIQNTKFQKLEVLSITAEVIYSWCRQLSVFRKKMKVL